MPYNRAEFAQQIKTKYPDYKDWNDDYLVDQILTKHPDYRSWVVDTPSPVAAPAPEPPGTLSNLWDAATTGYNAVSNVIHKPAEWLQAGYEKVRPAGYPERVGGALIRTMGGGALGQEMQGLTQQALDKLSPTAAGVYSKGTEMVETLLGDPMNAVPFGKIPVVSKTVAAFFAPGAIAGAVQALQHAADIKAAGGSQKEYAAALTEYFGNAGFAYLMSRQLAEGKAPEQIASEVQERFEPPKGIAGEQLTLPNMGPEVGPVAKGVGQKTKQLRGYNPPPAEIEAAQEGVSNRMKPYDWENLGKLEGVEEPAGTQRQLSFEEPMPETPPSPGMQRIQAAKASWQEAIANYRNRTAPASKPAPISDTGAMGIKLPGTGRGGEIPPVQTYLDTILNVAMDTVREFRPPDVGGEIKLGTDVPKRTVTGMDVAGETRPRYSAEPEPQPDTYATPEDLSAALNKLFRDMGVMNRMKEDVTSPAGVPATRVTVTPETIARVIYNLHEGKPFTVQARLFKRGMAETLVHELAHAADFNRSLHTEVESGIPGFSKAERFDLINDLMQRKLHDKLVEVANTVPDDVALSWYFDALGYKGGVRMLAKMLRNKGQGMETATQGPGRYLDEFISGYPEPATMTAKILPFKKPQLLKPGEEFNASNTEVIYTSPDLNPDQIATAFRKMVLDRIRTPELWKRHGNKDTRFDGNNPKESWAARMYDVIREGIDLEEPKFAIQQRLHERYIYLRSLIPSKSLFDYRMLDEAYRATNDTLTAQRMPGDDSPSGPAGPEIAGMVVKKPETPPAGFPSKQPTAEEMMKALYERGMKRPSGQPPEQLPLDQMIDSILKQRGGTGGEGAQTAPPKFVRPDNEFTRLADAQRGEPESKMLTAANRLGGGVMQYVIEHVGDLTHRMSEGAQWGKEGTDWGYNNTVDKINKVLTTLTHGYGFGREHFENLEANARYHGIDPTTYKSTAHKALQEYADAHKKLVVVNTAQRLARDAAIAVGELRPQDAVRHLRQLKELIGTREGYIENVWKRDPEFGSETGALSLQPVVDLFEGSKRIPSILWRHGGQVLRATAAGQFSTAVTNVTSGLRMALKTSALSPLAAADAKRQAFLARRRGDAARAAEFDTSAKYYLGLSKQYGKLTFGELINTISDMTQFAMGKAPKTSKFDQRLTAMEQLGGKRTAKRLREFSSPEATPDTRLKKALLFFSIAGDRFHSRLTIGAHMEALERAIGAKNNSDMIRMAAQNPRLKEYLHRTLEAAGAEALRASWNLPWARGAYHRAMRGMSELPGIGLVAAPYGKAMFANFLPNIAEQAPGLHMLSQRVRDSYKYEALRNTMHETQALRDALPKGDVMRKQLSQQLSKMKAEVRSIEEQGVYDTSMMNARAVSGVLLIAGAAAVRVLRGDDGTEYDQLAVTKEGGKATKVATWAGALGEDLPYVYIGDLIGHMILAKRSGKDNTKYSVKEGLINLGAIPEAFFGSRYGFKNPAVDLLTTIADGKKTSVDYLERMANSIASSIGRMAGAGAWVGQGARKIAETASEEERYYRRTDLADNPAEALKQGVQSQIPGWRQSLPKSPSWGEMRNARVEDPMLGMLTGANRTIVTPIQRFLSDHQGKIDPSAVYPRRTGDSDFDQMRLEIWSQLVRDRVIKKVMGAPKFATLNEDAQVERFRSVMAGIREASEGLAIRRYQREKGGLPPSAAQKQYEERAKAARIRGKPLPPKPNERGPTPRRTPGS